MFIKLLRITASAVIFASAQTAAGADHTHQKSDAQAHAGYVKPGAAVALSHDYDGKTQLGEFETITASISHIYESGALSITLLSPPELQVSAFVTVQNSPIYQGSTFELPIQFSAAVNGAFTLSFETVYESPEGQQSRRVLSIPVYIGTTAVEKSNSVESDAIKTVSKTGVIGLAAIEVIE